MLTLPTIMAVLLFLLAFLSTSYGLTLKKRVEYLEMHVSSLSLQTKHDIMDLRNMIDRLNFTGLLNVEEAGTPDTAGAKSEEMLAIFEKMEDFVENQNERMTVLQTAFAEEKMRNRIRDEQSDVIEEDSQVNEKVRESIEELNDRIDMADFDRNMTSEEVMGKISNLTAIVEKLSAKLQKLEKAGIPAVVPGAERGATVKPGPPCPSGWGHWQDLCYIHMPNESVMWEVANMRCHDHGGILAEPDTEEAMMHVFSLVGIGTSNNVWIGATDEQTDGTWIWVDSKKPVRFFKWESGQPNNYGGQQDCMEVYRGHLNDEKCGTNNQYICQRNARQP